MPFRAMAKMTGGWVPMTMAQGFADLANLHIPEGFGRIIGGFVGNLAANAAWGWKLRRIKTGKTETALPRCFPKVRSLKKRADVLYAGRSLSAVTWQGSAVYAAEPAICAVHGSAAGTLTSALGLVGGLPSAIGMLVIWPIANRFGKKNSLFVGCIIALAAFVNVHSFGIVCLGVVFRHPPRPVRPAGTAL